MVDRYVFEIGSVNLVVGKVGNNIIYDEKNVILECKNGEKISERIIGSDACQAVVLDSTKKLCFPINQGVIRNDTKFISIIQEIFNRYSPKGLFKKNIDVMVCIGCGLTNPEKDSIEKSFIKAGARDVCLVESVLAIDNFIGVSGAKIIIDFGATKTDIALLDNDGIIEACSILIGSSTINYDIKSHYLDYHTVSLNDETAEEIKMAFGSLEPKFKKITEISTKFSLRTTPVKVTLNSDITVNIIKSILDTLIKTVGTMVLHCPDKGSYDLINNGIFLTGRGSLIPYTDKYIEKKLNLPVTLLKELEVASVKGGLDLYKNK